MVQAISVPAVIVNNETIPIVPNSLEYDGGEAEINVRTVSGGGGNVQTVHTQDAETAYSEVKFEMTLTTDVDGKISEWKEKINGNVISFVQKVGAENVKRSFRGMSLQNKPKRTASADGTV